jgi:L-lactate dehydrogenase complex protein LldF
MREHKKDHAALADEFNKDEPRVDWHDQTLWWVGRKETRPRTRYLTGSYLRDTASRIKDNVLSN